MAKRSPSSPTSTRKRATPKTAHQAQPEQASSAAPTASIAPSEEEIRVRAYHRYLERGGTHGADFDDWVEAEKDLKTTRHN